MTVTDVLTLCDARGVQLIIDGHELRARGRKGAVNDVLKQGIVQYKAELIEALYEREERLAIQEEGQTIRHRPQSVTEAAHACNACFRS